MQRVLLLAVLACTAAACGKSPGERVAEAAVSAASGQKVSVDKDGGQVTFKTDQGDVRVSSGDAATLPATFPKDVHLPPGYKVESAMQSADAIILGLAVPGDLARLAGDTERAMAADGWKQQTAMQSGQGKLYMYEKDKRSAMISLAQGDDGQVRMGVQLATQGTSN
ncbi:MAG TPA: hypothetical protein VLM17_09110 [Xanthomonadaceae bacterium]|nr:hypothetical protein [Xanthomonadaceae bacterium]